jgi:hypothetical protein
MPDLSKTTCSGAFILHCTATGNEISGCFVDESIDSNNYRGELLGALGPLLILRAAFESNPSLASSPETIATIYQLLHCDNNGVVGHGNDQQGPLKQDQTQSDLIRLLKSYSRRLPFRTKWIHVKGHSDRYQAFSQLTLIEQLNVRCDAMAKKCLIDTIASRVFIVPTFPDEDITLAIGANKIRSSIRKAIYSHWGRSVAKNLFSKRDKVLRSSFDFIYWDCMNKVMSSFVKTFQDWVTRHISDFNGCNRYLSRFNSLVKNVCPSCHKKNEDTVHILRCPDPVRTQLYNEGVDQLFTWLVSNNTPPDLAQIIKYYIAGRGSSTMESLVNSYSPYYSIAKIQDLIGFDNLLVGRLPKALVLRMAPILANSGRRGLTAESWASRFSRELLLFTHRQWSYRNSTVHFKPAEGKTISEHEAVTLQVQSIMSMNPRRLPRHHRHLLLKQDFARLGAGSTIHKQFWLAEVESALAEAAMTRRIKKKKYKSVLVKCIRKRKVVYRSSIISSFEPPATVSEKGLKWKKRRQK